MFKTALRSSQGLRSLPTFVRTLANQRRIIPSHTLAFSFITSSDSGFPPFSTLSSPFSSWQILRRRHRDDNFNDNDEYNRDPKGSPKLFVVQPRLRPEPVLQVKLEEALNLANSLEEQRDGYYETEFSEKALPPHVVVQNPTARSPRAGGFFFFFFSGFVSSAMISFLNYFLDSTKKSYFMFFATKKCPLLCVDTDKNKPF